MTIRSDKSSRIYLATILSVLVAGLSACSADPTANAPATYANACAFCHGAATSFGSEGIGGAPAVGDKEDWERRTSKGMATVYANAINGLEGATGIMPAKGSRPDLSDEEIKKLVDWMVEASL
jgi:cytochrome c5